MEGCEFKPWLGYLATGKLSVSFQWEMGSCFKFGKDKQQKERDLLSLSYTMPNKEWASNPYCSLSHLTFRNLGITFRNMGNL